MNILNRALTAGLLPVFDNTSTTSALTAMQMLVKCGIPAIELAHRQPDSLERFKELRKSIECLGAGTITNARDATKYLLAGAKFIVGPNFSAEVARLCYAAHVPYMPGFQTSTEMYAAIDAGASALKFFPAGGQEKAFRHIKKAMPADLSQMQFLASGGPSLYTATDWIRAGFDAIVLPQRELAWSNPDEFNQLSEPVHSVLKQIETFKHKKSLPASATA